MPGELMFVTATKMPFPGVGNLLLFAAVDSYSSHAFGMIRKYPTAKNAILLIDTKALPAFKERGCSVRSIVTTKGLEFGPEFSGHLQKHSIEHRQLPSRVVTHGFVERFRLSVKRIRAGRCARRRIR